MILCDGNNNIIMDWVHKHMACTWCIVGLGNPSEAG